MGRAIGRAFRITGKQARSYDRTAKPRGRPMRANPMGVTTLAQVNGRGASARAASRGRTKAQRLARARKLMRNAKGGFGKKHRAAFMSANLKAKRGKRLGAYKSALSRGMSKNGARRSALKKVPFTASERKHGATFAGSRARYHRNQTAAQYEREVKAQIAAEKKEAAAAPKPARKSRKTKGKGTKVKARKTKGRKGRRKGKRKGAKRRTTRQYSTVRVTTKRKRRVAYGKYKRAKLYNPRTGRTEYSYMYRTKGGRLRRIPTAAVAGWMRGEKGEAATKRAAAMRKAREKASKRILEHGDVFTPNKRRKSRKKAAKKAARTRKRIANLRAQGYTKSEARALAKGGKKVKRRRRKARRAGTKRRRATKRRVRRMRANARRPRRSRKRRATKRRATRRRARRATKRRTRRRSAKRRSAKRRTRRRGTKRRARRSGRRRMRANRRYRANRRHYENNRKRRSRRKGGRRRRSGKRRMRRNAFMASLGQILKTGALATVGFVSHRVLTSLTCDYLFVKVLGATPNPTLVQWQKPICGAAVGLVGVGFLSFAGDKNWLSRDTTLALGAGMVASWLQSVVVSALLAANQPAVAGRLEGYSNSLAYSLHGRRSRHRRGMHGMQSIMPRYVPVGAYEQAAAGLGRRHLGEYFTGMAAYEQAAAGVGEYFVPAGTKGVGQYEPAGPLATQATASSTGPIDDGIRPDSNLDHVLDLAEAAAGLGEFITATPNAGGGYDESTVGMSSQWIPNGPLWAGTLGTKANTETSEIPAGILATPGGNGILSG